MNNNIKIVIFGFNRHAPLMRLVEKIRLQHNGLPVTIYLDGPRDSNTQDEVEQRKILADLKGIEFISLVRRGENLGLYENIKSAITEEFNHFRWLIVLEDDLEIKNNFVEEIENAISFISTEEKIFVISGFTEFRDRLINLKKTKYTLRRRFSCWGFAINRDSWTAIDWTPLIEKSIIDKLWYLMCCVRLSPDMMTLYFAVLRNKVSSWAFYAALHQAKTGQYSLHINSDLVENNGIGENSTHTSSYSFLKKRSLKETKYSSLTKHEELRIFSWVLSLFEIIYRKTR